MKKIIDNQGKIFGLINPVDLGIILILFILAIVVLKRYQPEPLNLKQQVAVYGIVSRNIPSYIADSITVGQELIQDPTGISLGVIYGKKSQPAEILLTGDGKITPARSPQNVDLHLELRRYARVIKGPSQYGIFVYRLPLRVGAAIRAHTLYTQVTGQIDYLKVENNDRHRR